MSPPYPAADRRRVFLVSRSIFSGKNAQIRQSKAIRRVMDENSNSFVALNTDFGVNKTAEVIKNLLENQIFESELEAKSEFPELFQTSPARDLQHTESENDAARSEAEALEDLASPDEITRADEHEKPQNTATPMNAPSLYPPQLPYSIQHIILTSLQRQLEECCFNFATKWLPTLLTVRRWDCPEAVELTKWGEILPKLCEKLPADVVQPETGVSLQEIFSSISLIRHSAVHRLPTSGKGVLNMIRSALRLTMALGDVSKAAALESLEADIECRIKDMELNKNFLENRLDGQLLEISQLRTDLDRREEEAIAKMLREDKENSSYMGTLLEHSVRNVFGIDEKRKGKRKVRVEDHRPQMEDDDSDDIDGMEMIDDGEEDNDDGVFVALETEGAAKVRSLLDWM